MTRKMMKRTVTKVTTAMAMRMVLEGKWPWLWFWFSECKWCCVYGWFFVSTVGDPSGVVVVLASMNDHRENQEKKMNGFVEMEKNVGIRRQRSERG